MKKVSIKELPEDERPRERLLKFGPENLTDAELLAILIGSGTSKMSAVEVMKNVLAACKGNLNTLGRMSVDELTNFDGIGPAKAITILAACELGKRRQRADIAEKKDMSSAANIYEYMRTEIADKQVEEAWVLLLNQNYRLIKSVRISHGGLTETAVDLRVVMKQAILANATVIALCHNHPSNNPHPSSNDDRLTQNVKKACEYLRFYFVDHVIVCDGVYYSYREHGRL
ncbi:MAG: RadC family protein [Prevotella sp.]|jgi:DNA repair protein RadC